MKKILIVIILCAQVLFALSAAADYPELTGYVNDYAGLLTPPEESALADMISEYEKTSSIEMAIVTVNDTGGEDRIIYASRTGDKNGVGKEGTDNGVVILWSRDNELGGAIATGRGIGSVLNDAKVSRIGRESRELFDSGRYFEGFKKIILEIETESSGEYPVSREPEENWPMIAVIALAAAIIFICIIVMLAGRPAGRSRDKDYWMATSYLGTRSYDAWHPIGGSSGWGGGGGFGGFGGGSFGGGGGKF